MSSRHRTVAFAIAFWAVAAAFIAVDWHLSTPLNRFDEPPPWQLGQESTREAGHCAAPLK
jgi:hypothetical protein